MLKVINACNKGSPPWIMTAIAWTLAPSKYTYSHSETELGFYCQKLSLKILFYLMLLSDAMTLPKQQNWEKIFCVEILIGFVTFKRKLKVFKSFLFLPSIIFVRYLFCPTVCRLICFLESNERKNLRRYTQARVEILYFITILYNNDWWLLNYALY